MKAMKRLSVGLIITLILASAAQRSDVHAQPDLSKLATVLADLAQAVPQDSTTQSRADRAASVRPLALDSLPKAVRDAVHSRRLRIDADNGVQAYVLVHQVDEDTLRQLRAVGVTIELTDPAHRRVQVRIPVTRLQMVASLPFVDFVRLPTYGVRRTGLVTSEGDAILRADLARRQWSVDGSGVKIGVISDGLKGLFATGCTTCGGVAGGPIETGDLPDAVGTRNARGVLTASAGGIVGRSFQANNDLEGLPPTTPPCAFAGAGAEGTALLEIIHDLAPGAQLAFANADTDLAFNQAVNFLASTSDVVVDDLGFFGEAYDGTSPVSSNTASALNDPANRIRTYVTSAGNNADEHYFGGYVDSGVDGSSIGGVISQGHLHLFQQSDDTTDVLGLGRQPYNVISLPANGEVAIFLTWDDSFGASSNNYDLYLVQQSTGRVVARSTNVQNGGQDPVEIIDYVNTTGAGGFFRIVVQNVRNQAKPRNLNVFSFTPECAAAGPRLLAANHHERHNYNTASRSVSAQSDAGGSPASVVSVGAICSASAAAADVFSGSSVPDESCADRTNSTREFFSSIGPTIDGRGKPDISAIDGVSITGAGRFENPFFGTSAAAPHVAAIAGLVLQAAPCLMADSPGALDPDSARMKLRDLIVTTATPLSDAIPDNQFGFGRVDAASALQGAVPTFKGAQTLTVRANAPSGATLSADQLGFSDSNQCAISRLSWTGGCGTSPGSTMTCPFGATTVSVSASSNGVAFSAPVSLQITVVR
jgi:hypothetical protein